MASGIVECAIRHSARPIVLDVEACTIQIGASRGYLRPMSAALLDYLARHREVPVTTSELAKAFGVRSSVDITSATRQAITTLRAELRVLGLADLVISRRGIGYALQETASIDVRRPGDFAGSGGVDQQPAPEPGMAGHRLPERPVRAAMPPRVEPVVSSLGTVDTGSLSVWLHGRRLLPGNQRDFVLLATLVARDGLPVDERTLMQACGYGAVKSGAELLRRACRRVNALLQARGFLLRIVPDEPGYGSGYRLMAGGRPGQVAGAKGPYASNAV